MAKYFKDVNTLEKLVCVTDDLKENEPDAINTIDEMERAASVICDLQTDLSYYETEGMTI